MTTLDELRRANLQEQRRAAERAAARQAAAAAQAPPTPQTGETEQIVPANGAQAAQRLADRLTSAPTDVPAPSAAVQHQLEPAVQPHISHIAEPANATLTPEPATQPTHRDIAAFDTAHQQANGAAAVEPTPAPAGVLQPSMPPASESEPPSEDFAAVVRERLSKRVIYRTGVKATVDMPPELFWRLKRYCHDHNNLTVRQAFLDLMIAYLEHEGY